MRNSVPPNRSSRATAWLALVSAPLSLLAAACGDGAPVATVGCSSAADCPSRVCVEGRCVDPGDEGDTPAPFDDVAPDAPLDVVVRDDAADSADPDAADAMDTAGDAPVSDADDASDEGDEGDAEELDAIDARDALDPDAGDATETSDATSDDGGEADGADTGDDAAPAPTLTVAAAVVADRWAEGEPALGYGGAANGVVDVGEVFEIELTITNTSAAPTVLSNVTLTSPDGGLGVVDGEGVIDPATIEPGAAAVVTSLTLDAVDASPGADRTVEVEVGIEGGSSLRSSFRLRPRDARLVVDDLATISRTSGLPENPQPGGDYGVTVVLRSVGADDIVPATLEGNAGEPPTGARTLQWEATTDSAVAELVGAGADSEGTLPAGEELEFLDGVVFVVAPTAVDGDAICLAFGVEGRVDGGAVYRFGRTWCTTVGFGTEPFCLDPDTDSFGTGTTCLGPDCDETRGEVNPAAVEVCDGLDNDCDGGIDNTGLFWFRDSDSDGWGDNAAVVPDCAPGAGWVPRGGDCDDVAGTSYPGAPEPCDGADNDCNLTIDDGVLFDTDRDNCGECGNVCPEFTNCVEGDCSGFCLDVDGDGYFGAGACARAGEDCNDASNTINPAAIDTCGNGTDENCDGLDAICPRPCDYIAQDCGAGAKCAFGGASGFICVRNGTAPVDAACTFAGGVDTCAASGICIEWDTPGTDTCHELCRDDSHCANLDEICALTLSGAGDVPIADACVDARRCNPIAQDCALEDRCDSWQDPRLAQTSFRCLTNGTIPRGGDCTGGVGACERGNACVGSPGAYFCRPFCTLPSGAGCPGGFGCATITGWPSSVGACVPL